MGRVIPVCVVALVVSTTVLATGSAAEQDECADPQAQQQMNDCAAQEFWKLDEDLTMKYEEALAYTRKRDTELPPPAAPDLKTRTEALTIAGKAWLQYRDARCDGMGYHARGGTLEAPLVGNCKIELTKPRIKELMTSLED